MTQRYHRRTVLKALGSGTAAAGLASVSAAESTSTVLIDGRDAEHGLDYSLVVSGEIVDKSTAHGASINDSDGTTTSGAWGSLWGGRDAFEFTGDLEGFRSDGDPAVVVDGEAVDPPTLDVVTVERDSSDSVVEYDLSVSGSLAKSTAAGASVNASDSADGDTVSGKVWGGTDSFAFTGDVTGVSPADELTVLVNGEPLADDGSSSGGDSSSDGDGSSSGEESRVEALEAAIRDEVNARREENGLDTLSRDETLAAAARAHSRDMVENDYFSHTAPGDDSFADHYRDEGVSCRGLGENILMRSLRADDPEEIAANAVAQWMNSSGHRRNILDANWAVDGVGVAFDGDAVYATQGFGYGCE